MRDVHGDVALVADVEDPLVWSSSMRTVVGGSSRSAPGRRSLTVSSSDSSPRADSVEHEQGDDRFGDAGDAKARGVMSVVPERSATPEKPVHCVSPSRTRATAPGAAVGRAPLVQGRLPTARGVCHERGGCGLGSWRFQLLQRLVDRPVHCSCSLRLRRGHQPPISHCFDCRGSCSQRHPSHVSEPGPKGSILGGT